MPSMDISRKLILISEQEGYDVDIASQLETKQPLSPHPLNQFRLGGEYTDLVLYSGQWQASLARGQCSSLMRFDTKTNELLP